MDDPKRVTLQLRISRRRVEMGKETSEKVDE